MKQEDLIALLAIGNVLFGFLWILKSAKYSNLQEKHRELESEFDLMRDDRDHFQAKFNDLEKEVAFEVRDRSFQAEMRRVEAERKLSTYRKQKRFL